jgi:hypothetical protein
MCHIPRDREQVPVDGAARRDNEMTALRHRGDLRAGMIAAACAAVGCGGPSGAGTPGGGPDGSAPGIDITVRVFPDGVPTLTGTTANADLVAFQDGDGDWVEVTGTGGVYHRSVAGDRYGVAVGCGSPLGGTEIYYQSVAEAPELAINGCVQRPPMVNIAVTIGSGGVGGQDVTEVWIGRSIVPATPGGFAAVAVDQGTQDIYGRAFTAVPPEEFNIRVYRPPSLDVETDQVMTIDWTRASSAVSFPLTIADPMNTPGTWGMSSSYLMPHGHGLRQVEEEFGKPTSYSTVGPAQRQSGDVARVEVSETGGTTPGGPLPVRSAFREMTTPTAVILEPADYLGAAPPAIDTNAVSQLSVTVPIRASKLGHTVSAASFTTDTIVQQHYLSLFVRPGWAGNAASVTLKSPDLRNCASWTTGMELTGRTEVDWVLSVLDQDQPLDAPLGQGRIAVESTVLGRTVPGQHAIAAPRPGRSPFARRVP